MFAAEQRHRGGDREDAQARLCPPGHLAYAETVMRLLPAWFEDYNTIYPHSGLRMLSPREYLSWTA
ncbi:hypothetical protein MRA01_62830 [Methylobacterium radiotolerans]|nr:hypothetical protein MRA01_62830 [Methylobacterium radiotolerans]